MESTLSAAYADLLADVGDFLGYGRGPTFADTTTTARVDRCVKGGIRFVYFCGYDWSFLKPYKTLTLPNNSTVIPLPDDFGGPEGQLTLTSSTSQIWFPLDFVGLGQIYAQASLFPSQTGKPIMVAIEPLKGTTGTQGQRFQLKFFPTSDQSYSVQLRYYLLDDYKNAAFPYVYGGGQHAETYLAAAKAWAEINFDDISGGPQFSEFERLLEVSKDVDRRSKGSLLGYNGDRSDNKPWKRNDMHYLDTVKVYGQTY